MVFAQQKQSVLMSIDDFTEISILVYLICFSIYRKIQPAWKNGRKMHFGVLCRTSKTATKNGGKTIFRNK